MIETQKYTVQTYPKHSRTCSETKSDPCGAPPTPLPPRALGHSQLSAQPRNFCVLASTLRKQNFAIRLARQQHRTKERVASFRQLGSRLIDPRRRPGRTELARWILGVGLSLNALELRVKQSPSHLVGLLVLREQLARLGGFLLGRYARQPLGAQQQGS